VAEPVTQPAVGTGAEHGSEAIQGIAASSGRVPPRTRGGRSWWGLVVILVAFVYFVAPLVATAGFALSDGRHFTLQPLIDALGNADFLAAMELSLGIAVVTTVVSIVIVAPTSYLVVLRFRRLRTIVDFVTILPFVIPPIILTLGLRQVYGADSPLGINLVDSPLLLVGGYFVLSLPFTYRAVDNAMRAVDVVILTEASESLGAGVIRTFRSVILPGTRLGVLSAALLCFTTIMGEFTLASLLGYATFPVFLNNTYASAPREATALVIVSFIITWAGVLALAAVGRRSGSGTSAARAAR
jgi:putative spermidine/putrescine transport system permease protein